MKPLSSLKNAIFDFFFPRLCIGCEKPLNQNENLFCIHCLYQLPETNFHLVETSIILDVFKGRLKLQAVAACFYYKKSAKIQRILHYLKYKNKPEIGIWVGHYYGQKLLDNPLYQSVDYIIPIPLHPKKQKKRGYNQSEMFALGLSEVMHIPYLSNCLYRITDTSTQTKKNRISRWKNVSDIFELKNFTDLENKHILLCDDVLTTGATIEAAGLKLLEIKGLTLSIVTIACAIE